MAKRDMDIHTCKLRNSKLNKLITKYNIPLDLNPRLPDASFRMSDLPDDAIGIYTRILDFSGVRIPFSSFLLAVLKHFKVHISQLVPLGLNKIITFEVLCLSRNIEPTVDLFRKFQTLTKQGDWFSFAKLRQPAPVCMDDNKSSLKDWKEKFFLIDRRAIPHYMPWRHPESSITDDLHVCDFIQDDVIRLGQRVVRLRILPEGVLVLSGLSRVWKSPLCDPVLRRHDGTVMSLFEFMCMPSVDGTEVREEFHDQSTSILERIVDRATPPTPVGTDIPGPTPEEFAATQPNSKVIAKARSTAKRKASTRTEGSTDATKRNRVGEEHSGAGSYEQSSGDELADGDTPHDDAGATVDDSEHAEGNPGGDGLSDVIHAEHRSPTETAVVGTEAVHGAAGDTHPAAETGDQVHNDTGGDASHHVGEDDESEYGDLRSEFRYEPREGDTTGDALETEFLQPGPYYMPYPYDDSSTSQLPPYTREQWDDFHAPFLGVMKKEIFKDPQACREFAQRAITPAEALRVGDLTTEQLSDRMSVLTCLMLSHSTALNARYTAESDRVNRLSARYQQQKRLLDRQENDLKEQTKFTVSANEKVVELTKKLEQYDCRSTKSRKYKAERDDLKKEKEKVDTELAGVKSKLEASEAELRELRRTFSERESELHGCRDTIADRDRFIEKTRDDITSFFQHDFETLIRRFLGSGEFRRALAGVSSMAISAGFAHGLCICRSEDDILKITQKVSNFVPGAKEKLDEVAAALPNEVFPFFHKVSQHAGDALSAITQLEPDMVVSSHQISFATVAPSGVSSVVTSTVPSATVAPSGVSSIVTSTMPSATVVPSRVSSVAASTTKTFGYTSVPEHLKNKKASSTSRDSSGV